MTRRYTGRRAAAYILQALATLVIVHSSDVDILLDFKASQSTCPGHNPDLEAWTAASDPSTWYGVTWSNNALTGMHILGPVCGTAPDSFSMLTSLEVLVVEPHVDSVRFLGTLPSSWSTLTRLTMIGLSNHHITSTLPESWSALINLSSVLLNGNYLTGSAPSSWSTLSQLAALQLQSNRLSGSLPSEWSALTTLGAGDEVLYLHNNQFTGQLPSTWSTLSQLNFIDLSKNHFRGALPSTWSTLTHLQSVDLSYNNLNNSLPQSWSTLTQLNSLKLSQNQLTGSIPDSWSTLTQLDSLDLSGNPTSGALPNWLSKWKKLYTFAVPGTTATGGLPGWLLHSNSTLQVLSLPGYGFTGSFPLWLTTFSQLNSLNLSSNRLTGTLPTSLSHTTITSSVDPNAPVPGTPTSPASHIFPVSMLDLSNNSFTGPLPQDWGNATALQTLRLSHNRLSSTLPVTWTTLSKLRTLELTSCGLTGTVPHAWSAFSNLAALSLASNELTGTLPLTWPNGSWWAAAIYVDVSGNQLTGPLPPLPPNVQYFNAALNVISGSLPHLPASIAYLNVASNNLSGNFPDINSSSVVYLNLANNSFTRLPKALHAPQLSFLIAANNSLEGPIPADYTNHSLVYCDLSNNSLSGPIPRIWSSRHWQYLALDGNRLTGTLSPVWEGKVSMLLLGNNVGLKGCLPKIWLHNNSVNVISMSNTGITCTLPEEYAANNTFTSLDLLDLANSSISGTVPQAWLHGFHTNTSLRLGTLWHMSARASQSFSEGLLSSSSENWRRQVCVSQDLHSKLRAQPAGSRVNRTAVQQMQASWNLAVGNLTQTLQALNIMDVRFAMPDVGLRLRDNASQPKLDAICGNKEAREIVGILWAVLCVIGLGMVFLYSIEQWLGVTSHLRRSLRSSASRRSKLSWHLYMIWAPFKYFCSMALYWFDIVFDVIVLLHVWPVGGWPRYTLLIVLLTHYVLGAVLLSSYLPWALSCNRSFWFMFAGLVLVPAMPLLDVALLAMMVLDSTDFMHHSLSTASVSSIGTLSDMFEWQRLFEKREVLEVFVEAVPAVVLQSVIFVVGSKPDMGVYLSTGVYILSSVGSCVQILRLLGSVLWAAASARISLMQVLGDMMKSRVQVPVMRAEGDCNVTDYRDNDDVHLREAMQEL